ncbi:MAG: hypothetical protein AAF985_04670 [Bacteroidota bacterium]
MTKKSISDFVNGSQQKTETLAVWKSREEVPSTERNQGGKAIL